MSFMPLPRSVPSFLIAAVLTVPLVWVAWRINGFPSIGIDDANIFWVYAENLLEGHGLTYGGQHLLVEGFSSPLWLLCSIGIMAAGLGVTGVLIFEVLLGVTAVACVGWIGARLQPEGLPFWAGMVFPVMVLLLHPGYVIWQYLTGMDVTLWTTLLIGFTVLMLRVGFRGGMWCIPALILTRPESLIAVPFLILSYSVLYHRLHRRREWGAALLLWVCSWGGVWVIRWRVYGSWWPNTYYAKFHPVVSERLMEGWTYLQNFFSDHIGMLCFAVFSVCSLLGWAFRRSRNLPESPGGTELAWLSLIGGMLLSLAVFNGGDHFAMYRMIQPAMPFLVLSGCGSLLVIVRWGLDRFGLSLRGNRIGFAGISLLTLACLPMGQRFPWVRLIRADTTPLRREFDIAERAYENGQDLQAVLTGVEPMPALGVVVAGAVARSYRGPVIDLMGLNHPGIGRAGGGRIGVKNHAAFRKHFLKDYDVDLLLADPSHEFMQMVLRGIFQDPAFAAEWRYGILQHASFTSPELFLHQDTLHRLLEQHRTFRITRVWEEKQWIPVTSPSASGGNSL
jgi:hypothetical protein